MYRNKLDSIDFLQKESLHWRLC